VGTRAFARRKRVAKAGGSNELARGRSRHAVAEVDATQRSGVRKAEAEAQMLQHKAKVSKREARSTKNVRRARLQAQRGRVKAKAAPRAKVERAKVERAKAVKKAVVVPRETTERTCLAKVMAKVMAKETLVKMTLAETVAAVGAAVRAQRPELECRQPQKQCLGRKRRLCSRTPVTRLRLPPVSLAGCCPPA
jgi:hypothetical protein